MDTVCLCPLSFVSCVHSLTLAPMLQSVPGMPTMSCRANLRPDAVSLCLSLMLPCLSGSQLLSAQLQLAIVIWDLWFQLSPLLCA